MDIEGAIRLRTLARKSVLWFGKHHGLSVQQLLDLHKATYLRWVYYNIAGVSFSDEILEEITIRVGRRIEKPGIAPEIHQEVSEENLQKISFKTRSHFNKVMRGKKIILQRKSDIRATLPKGIMQAYNHDKM